MNDDNTLSLIRLLPALPKVEYVQEPEVIDRILIRLYPDGRLYFRGTRARIEEFLRACAADGIGITVDHIALCG